MYPSLKAKTLTWTKFKAKVIARMYAILTESAITAKYDNIQNLTKNDTSVDCTFNDTADGNAMKWMS